MADTVGPQGDAPVVVADTACVRHLTVTPVVKPRLFRLSGTVTALPSVMRHGTTLSLRSFLSFPASTTFRPTPSLLTTTAVTAVTAFTAFVVIDVVEADQVLATVGEAILLTEVGSTSAHALARTRLMLPVPLRGTSLNALVYGKDNSLTMFFSPLLFSFLLFSPPLLSSHHTKYECLGPIHIGQRILIPVYRQKRCS